jgi:uncharacterized protein YyaL (SSP411 family)
METPNDTVPNVSRARGRRTGPFAAPFMLLALLSATAAAAPATVPWLRSDAQAFARARDEHRFVLLYLEAVWCHWCHVMDEKTYGNAEIAAEIAARYVPLRIDQDLRPDLANRYKDYGWPATIVFAPDGSEIVKRQGFIEPQRFLRLLRAIEADPSPETADAADASPAMAPAGTLDEATRAELVRRHRETHDAKLGSLATGQKYLDRDSVEYEMVRAADGDAQARAMALRTLDAARALFDPAWGGVYQYSTYGDWKHAHFEKLATVQAQYLRIYALAWAAFGRDPDREAVASIRGYVDAFLKREDGAFFASQDADLVHGEHADDYFALGDRARRARGIPRIDTHVYAAQNGQLIEALATWAEVAGDRDALAAATRAAERIIAERALPDGGFRHDAVDAAGPYLADTLAMGRAFLALYRASADRAWLGRADAAAGFIARRFASAHGFVGAQGSGPIAAVARTDENIALARFTNLLARYTGRQEQRDTAEAALRFLADPRVALAEITEPGILLADGEFHSDPLHVTVVGAKADAGAAVLFSTLQHLAPWYKRVEWWDKGEGPLPNPDVAYPAPKRAAAYVCSENRCSLPIFAADQIAEFVLNSHPSH